MNKNILTRIFTALVIIILYSFVYYFFPVTSGIFPSLLFFAFMVIITSIAMLQHQKSLAFGIVYGLITIVVFAIIFLVQEVISRI